MTENEIHAEEMVLNIIPISSMTDSDQDLVCAACDERVSWGDGARMVLVAISDLCVWLEADGEDEMIELVNRLQPYVSSTTTFVDLHG